MMQVREFRANLQATSGKKWKSFLMFIYLYVLSNWFASCYVNFVTGSNQ